MQDIKVIIWDVDGTLLDTAPGMISSVKYMINKIGLPQLDEESLQSFVGPRIQDSLRRIYNLSGDELINASTVFRNHYKEGDVLDAVPYDGVKETLEKLREKGIRMCIATNKRQDFVDALLEKFDMTSYFDIVCGTDFNGKYTKSDLVKKCVNFYQGISNDEIVMIGDSEYDAEAAHCVGVRFIAALYGYDFTEASDINLWNPIGKVDSIKKVIGLLN